MRLIRQLLQQSILHLLPSKDRWLAAIVYRVRSVTIQGTRSDNVINHSQMYPSPNRIMRLGVSVTSKNADWLPEVLNIFRIAQIFSVDSRCSFFCP